MKAAKTPQRQQEDWVLRLYVAGHSPKSMRAIANLQKICEENLQEYKIEVIDLLEQPQLAKGRSDPSGSDACQKASKAYKEDHRRFVELGSSTGWAGCEASGLTIR